MKKRVERMDKVEGGQAQLWELRVDDHDEAECHGFPFSRPFASRTTKAFKLQKEEARRPTFGF